MLLNYLQFHVTQKTTKMSLGYNKTVTVILIVVKAVLIAIPPQS